MTQALGSTIVIIQCVLFGILTGIGLVGPGGIAVQMSLSDILLGQLVSVIGVMVGISIYHDNR